MTSPKELFLIFLLVVSVGGAAVWAWSIDERTESISTIVESADRIEAVASSTERMLADALEAQQTPEAVEQRVATRRAVSEIHHIKLLLCELPELSSHEACP